MLKNIQYYDLQAQYSFSAMPLRILKLSFQPHFHLFYIYITSVSNLPFISFVATFFQFHHEETQISSWWNEYLIVMIHKFHHGETNRKHMSNRWNSP